MDHGQDPTYGVGRTLILGVPSPMIHGMTALDPRADGGRVFDGEPRRREIALECSRKPGSTYDVARRLGYEEGSISQTVRTLAKYGVLIGERPRGSKGTQYRLNSEWSAALKGAERRATTGLLMLDSDLVVVDAPALGLLWDLLERPSVRADVAWITELRDSTRGALISVEPDNPAATRGLVEALRQGNAHAERLTIGPTTAQDDLAELARATRRRHS